MDALFMAIGRHQLHADADAEERHAARNDALLHRVAHAAHGAEPVHAIGEGADARQDDAVGLAHDVWIVADDDIGVGPDRPDRALEGFCCRAQIARAIVDDRDRAAHFPARKSRSARSGAGATRSPAQR